MRCAAASLVRCWSCPWALAAAAAAAAAESAAARAADRCSLTAATFSTTSLLFPSCPAGDSSRAVSCTCTASPGSSANGARSRVAAPAQSAVPPPASFCSAGVVDRPSAHTRQMRSVTFCSPWSSLATICNSTFPPGVTFVSADGARISADGAESGTTSIVSGGGTSAIAALVARARSTPSCRSPTGVNRPRNRRSSGARPNAVPALHQRHGLSGSDACPSIASSVPLGTRSGASDGQRLRGACAGTRDRSPAPRRRRERTIDDANHGRVARRAAVARDERQVGVERAELRVATPFATESASVSAQAFPVVRRRSATCAARSRAPCSAHRVAAQRAAAARRRSRGAAAACRARRPPDAASARQPSGRRRGRERRRAARLARAPPPRRGRRVERRRCSAGASDVTVAASRSPSRSAARATNALPVVATSSSAAHRTTRSRCSRSTVVRDRGRVRFGAPAWPPCHGHDGPARDPPRRARRRTAPHAAARSSARRRAAARRALSDQPRRATATRSEVPIGRAAPHARALARHEIEDRHDAGRLVTA